MAWKKLVNLNLFDTETDDNHTKRNEILSTRIFVVLLILFLLLFILYQLLTYHSTLITVDKPTVQQYKNIEIEFSNSLQCPCTNISIPYKEFANITAKFYEICASDFISQRWIDYLFFENVSYFYQLDFRRSASSKFQLLRTLCQQAKVMTDDYLEEFYLEQLITNQIISNRSFHIQVGAFIDMYKRKITSVWRNSLELIRSTTMANRLFSAIETRSVYKIVYWSPNVTLMRMAEIKYHGGASIFSTFNCFYDNFHLRQLPEGIYADIDRYDCAGSVFWEEEEEEEVCMRGNTKYIDTDFFVPGMNAGCTPFESLLYSTNECLLDETCINQLIPYMNYSLIKNNSFTALKTSLSIWNITNENLAKELFIEDWIVTISYENYFNSCQPLFYQYTHDARPSFYEILIATLSVYGGLYAVLTLIVPNIVTFIRRQKRTESEDANIIQIPRLARLRISFRSIVNVLWNVNIFDSYSSDEYRRQSERISTKIYFLLLIICLIIFTTYTAIEYQEKTISIPYPEQTKFEQMKNTSLKNLQCPCDRIATKYSEFISFNPIFHQVCSGISITDGDYNDILGLYIYDIRTNFQVVANSFFEILSALCNSSRETVANNIGQLTETEYVTSEVMEENKFNQEVISFLGLFIDQTEKSFQEQLNLLRKVIAGNKVRYAPRGVITIDDEILNTVMLDSLIVYNNSVCSCATDFTCPQQMFARHTNRSENINLPGIYRGCYPIDMLFLSTMECFYNEPCMYHIKIPELQNFGYYTKFKPLEYNETSRYGINETLETLIGNLFIENWNENYSYSSYYNQCSPAYCSHIIRQRLGFIDILRRVIGFYGGLTIILKILVPSLIKLLRRKSRREIATSTRNRIHQLAQPLKIKLIQLNLFRNRSTNPEKLRQQILSTRLYLITFLILQFIIILYTSLEKKIRTETIVLKNLNHYKQLQNLYPNSLTCPCVRIAIEYKQFIQINPVFHPVCSSDFVTQEWFDFLYYTGNEEEQRFLFLVSAQFQVLSYLCNLTKETLDNNLLEFRSKKLTSNRMLSSQLFENEITSAVNLIKKSTPRRFKRALDLISGIIHGNFFITFQQTNWKFTYYNVAAGSPYYTNPVTYKNNSCTCGTSSKCTETSKIDGLLIGCYPLESLLQSSLKCLYNQTCLTSITELTENNESFEILSTNNQLYSIDETVQQMVDRLFVIDWFINQSYYEQYFKQCHPTLCTYSFISTFDLLRSSTTILSLYGGLTIILRSIIPLIIKIILRFLRRRRTTRQISTLEISN
ncbi:unnamed protein product [Adineta ricciae]|uniref:Uncharacterized protein n=1 Tax=Adineta ricciae TaxID=249248 RepID=A0A815SIQ7_ADIRI|nr:unnamed protein product [Adineta ricciae]CAF1521696.1 unnamed protein product [Adineta ricciae]